MQHLPHHKISHHKTNIANHAQSHEPADTAGFEWDDQIIPVLIQVVRDGNCVKELFCL